MCDTGRELPVPVGLGCSAFFCVRFLWFFDIPICDRRDRGDDATIDSNSDRCDRVSSNPMRVCIYTFHHATMLIG